MGEEALEKARAEDRPIFLSIGYSACHWCHVMERESFENEQTAELMNANFINVKVDREERPDLDAIYMDAVQAMTGSGGWPMSGVSDAGGQAVLRGDVFSAAAAPRHTVVSAAVAGGGGRVQEPAGGPGGASAAVDGRDRAHGQPVRERRRAGRGCSERGDCQVAAVF